jgi:hypothetical protein
VSRLVLSADTIDVTSSSALIDAYYISIDSQLLTIDAASSIDFGCNLTIRNTLQTIVLGQVTQVFSPSYCSQTSNPLNRIGVVVQGANVTFAASSVQYLLINAKTVTISGGYVGIPRAYNLSTCWANVNAEEFSCFKSASPPDVSSAHYLSNSITILGSSSITLSSKTTLRASFIALCAPVITSTASTIITTDGLGCPHDQGVGAGHISTSSSAGGGGGYGGEGGDGDPSALGGSVYGDGYNVFSVGSGAGTFFPSNLVTNTSGGGGIIVLNSTKSLSVSGTVSSGGSNGILNFGGGSGGLIALYARSLKGSGVIQAMGGFGGTSGGGGGGGGRIVLQNPGRYYDEYQFPGTMTLTGGAAAPGTSVRSESGFPGQLDFPICGPGYGNDYDTLTTCIKCPIGTYHSTYDGEECSKCKNKPENAEYIASGETTKDCEYQCYSGYVNDNCITPFERFLVSMGGLTSFVFVVGGFACLIFSPVYILRLRRKANLLKKEAIYQTNSPTASTLVPEIGASNWFNPVLDQHLLDREEKETKQTPQMKRPESLGNLEVGLDRRDQKKKTGLETFQELRMAHRMADKDLPQHCGRMYLWGNNSPFSHEGLP